MYLRGKPVDLVVVFPEGIVEKAAIDLALLGVHEHLLCQGLHGLVGAVAVLVILSSTAGTPFGLGAGRLSQPEFANLRCMACCAVHG